MYYNLRFCCRQGRVSKTDGLAALEMHLTANGKVKYYTLPLRLSPSEFEVMKNSAKMNQVREMITLYTAKVQNAVTALLYENADITIENIMCKVEGKSKPVYTIKQFFFDWLEIEKKKVDHGITLQTWVRYSRVIQFFLRHHRDTSLSISEVNNADITNFIVEYGRLLEPNTLAKYAAILKQAILFAMANGYITKNPFYGIKLKTKKTAPKIIRPEEYERIKSHHFASDRLNRVKDFFIFVCNCGLAYADMKNLNSEDIVKRGKHYLICGQRQKTGIDYTSIILPDGVEVLKKYNGNIKAIMMSNQKMNSYLTEIGDILGTSVKLHCHLARHYYITSLIRQRVPIEVVKMCAGHANIKMTMHYTHLTSDDVLNSVVSSIGF